MIDYESRVQRLYEAILRPGDACIDVGAHEGRHMFPMARCVAPGGRVFAFEPIPGMFEALRGEIPKRVKGPIVGLFPFAASDNEGESEFVLAVDNLGYSGLRERVYDTPTRLERIRVQTRKLDTVLSHVDALRFIKIDVEGGEWGVIRGAASLIERCRPVIGFEFGFNSYEKYGVDPSQVFEFFRSRDFHVMDILGRALEAQQFVESSRVQQVWDYAAAPSELSREVANALRGT